MRSYCVYLHTNKLNNKKYIGITCLKPEKRWNSGKGYTAAQPVFHNAIQKYGWENFSHEILFENLSKEQAIELEIKLIAEHKTTERAFGYNDTIGGEGHTLYKTEEEKQLARKRTVDKYCDKIKQDPELLAAKQQYYRDYANEKYRKIQEDAELYTAYLKEANARVKARKADPVEYQKILESKKRCKTKAKQDAAKYTKILEANRSSKQIVKTIRAQLFDLYESNAEVFTAEDYEVVFTKFSSESGCFKYNSAKRLRQILEDILARIEANK